MSRGGRERGKDVPTKQTGGKSGERQAVLQRAGAHFCFFSLVMEMIKRKAVLPIPSLWDAVTRAVLQVGFCS